MENGITRLKQWAIQRIQERTTLDGIVLIAAGTAYLIFKPIASVVAYGAILYGLYTILRSN